PVAEKLYTSGFISYPRTETDQFDPGIDLHALIGKQTVHPAWGAYAASLNAPNNNRYSTPRRGRNNDKAHPPIHPIACLVEPQNHDERKVYDFIVRRFLACC